MDPEAFATASMMKWDPRVVTAAAGRLLDAVAPSGGMCRPRELEGLEEVFQAYGVRYFTVAKMAELGFTVSTLLDMREEEIDDMMDTLSQIFRWELLVGERYGIKAALRAERRRLDDEEASATSASRRRLLLLPPADPNALDALSQEGLSEEPVQEAAGSGGGGVWEAGGGRKRHRRSKGRSKRGGNGGGGGTVTEDEDEEDVDEDDESGGGGVGERQREHPFIVTEPGEVARGKKNGLDYLFHLYEQCRDFLLQVQNIAKEKGDKCPTKVTNQVFRYAKKMGASYINKPKMRHYVHCYALHCLDEEASNLLRRAFKERGENVGAWRQACYKPLVAIAARQSWDIDAIFNAHPRLSVWYVPTKLRQLCHLERSNATVSVVGNPGVRHPF
ncbi:hypothetical protein H6P81_012638 [Aristolochia fimbriata]|uniref:Floricaula/leafy-like transcription factor n=1 Tax=Aristolochia fimbriata TaxID=158543 RepID=A0AAV7ECD7_ARIFI|nr:hypothetical protein H6P81_012638 [Aristolochia fimbriata]